MRYQTVFAPPDGLGMLTPSGVARQPHSSCPSTTRLTDRPPPANSFRSDHRALDDILLAQDRLVKIDSPPAAGTSRLASLGHQCLTRRRKVVTEPDRGQYRWMWLSCSSYGLLLLPFSKNRVIARVTVRGILDRAFRRNRNLPGGIPGRGPTRTSSEWMEPMSGLPHLPF